MASRKGTLFVIGGKEDREKDRMILRELAKHAGLGKICVATVASKHAPEDLWREYEAAFRAIGVRDVVHLVVPRRGEGSYREALDRLEGADCVFFTGGDQLKITSEIGGTEIEAKIRELYESGCVIAGTSAGASVMSETMIVSGAGAESYRIGGGLRMAPGLGFLDAALVDQHFTVRGRIGRLLAALAHNPKYVGLGLDENTAIVVRDGAFRVLGYGGVYVVDAHASSASNVSDGDRDTSLSIFNVQVHLLSAGDRFDFRTRRPELRPAKTVELKKPLPRPSRAAKKRPTKDRRLRPSGRSRSKGNDHPPTSPRA